MIYFNFINAPDGGGYQNSLSFMQSLIKMNFDFKSVVIICIENTSIEVLCIEHKLRFISVKRGAINKLVFEVFFSRKIKVGDVIFSLFGPPIVFTENRSLNIGGIAISNVFHADIDFWGYLPWYSKFSKWLKDRYRVWRYKKLDYWIFETELLQRLAISEFSFPPENCTVIKMSPSIIVSPTNVHGDLEVSIQLKKIKDKKLLFLCGAHPNKRLHLLPKIALELKTKGIYLVFVITAQDSEYLNSMASEAVDLGVKNYFYYTGAIAAEHVATVIDAIDYVCNFSLLESFSNNFVEAWVMKKPLLVTDASWARDSCLASAYYIDVESAAKSANDIGMVLGDCNIDSELVEAGQKMLAKHPTPYEKTLLYLNFIESAQKKGKLSKIYRDGISLW